MTLKITFVKLATNSENGVTGDLTLLEGTTVIKQSTAFSGGNSFNPMDDGKYRLRLDVSGGEETNQANTDGTLKPFFGIQKVGRAVQDDQGNSYNMQVEWGTIRARLNPTGGTDHGDYIHGKQRAKDWTHGCICDRSEVILNYLWDLTSPPAAIDVIVSGGENFDLESLIKKNIAKRLGPDSKVIRPLKRGRGKPVSPSTFTAWRTTHFTVRQK
ncbi:hypothetical protein ABIF38_000308 [Bradyrhizobium japonicum]|uniref:hypothetical protein n=1 Tax=Bradyrhizobium elkanii TaxID=29448 RepID=UPI001143226B|nr:hypothetical protein [Bradyrhizobium elkanii]MBP2435211.1 hypothetical protein [Bradyrhizobium elkanii]MCP1737627.1 hypothetical protein [Bradyrhizobium elkanii]MCS3576184.1 hypothetical protein [Bradyrhizobium elkanii]MCS3594481.1 hypothetical protein [Bradyrhizobium elkanii]MCS3626070.1 hypothetical protein [Bradyrhizobium elkanii]